MGVYVGITVGDNVGTLAAFCKGEKLNVPAVACVTLGTFKASAFCLNASMKMPVEIDVLSDVENFSYVAFGVGELKNTL